VSKKRLCYSFEPSGHEYQALDGFVAEGGTLVARLYCPKCGRVIQASSDYNTTNWDPDKLPAGSANDFWLNDPAIIRKES
jgi:hypothetical protein